MGIVPDVKQMSWDVKTAYMKYHASMTINDRVPLIQIRNEGVPLTEIRKRNVKDFVG